MRARPRTWPSIRLRRLRQDDFALGCILDAYPHRVYLSMSMKNHTHDHAGGCCHSHAANPSAAKTAKDPVCGMTVIIDTAKHTVEHAGHTYYFCSAGCRMKFGADPALYLADEK